MSSSNFLFSLSLFSFSFTYLTIDMLTLGRAGVTALNQSEVEASLQDQVDRAVAAFEREKELKQMKQLRAHIRFLSCRMIDLKFCFRQILFAVYVS